MSQQLSYLVKKGWKWEIWIKIKHKTSTFVWFVNKYHVVVPNNQLFIPNRCSCLRWKKKEKTIIFKYFRSKILPISWISKFIAISPFLRLDLLFVSTKAQPAFDWTQIQHMFWTILLVQFGEHDQLASKRFPRMIKSG